MKSLTSRLNFSGFSMNMKWFPPSSSSKISTLEPRIYEVWAVCVGSGIIVRLFHQARARGPICKKTPWLNTSTP